MMMATAFGMTTAVNSLLTFSMCEYGILIFFSNPNTFERRWFFGGREEDGEQTGRCEGGETDG